MGNHQKIVLIALIKRSHPPEMPVSTLEAKSPVPCFHFQRDQPIPINLVVAVDRNSGIGKENKLPWRLKSELAHFAKLTKTTVDFSKKNVVLMGRKTWESLPNRVRPLKGRLNMVLTRQSPEDLDVGDDVIVANSFKAAVDMLDNLKEEVKTCWVIGGSAIYEVALQSDRLERIFLTEINEEHNCDAYFPQLNSDNWIEVEDRRIGKKGANQKEGDITFKYKVLKRHK